MERNMKNKINDDMSDLGFDAAPRWYPYVMAGLFFLMNVFLLTMTVMYYNRG